MNCGCGQPIEPERLEALPNTKICAKCALANDDGRTLKGVMVWGHKTAGTIQVLSNENFAEHRRLNPYGRNTGRGSGVVRISRPTRNI